MKQPQTQHLTVGGRGSEVWIATSALYLVSKTSSRNKLRGSRLFFFLSFLFFLFFSPKDLDAILGRPRHLTWLLLLSISGPGKNSSSSSISSFAQFFILLHLWQSFVYLGSDGRMTLMQKATFTLNPQYIQKHWLQVQKSMLGHLTEMEFLSLLSNTPDLFNN